MTLYYEDSMTATYESPTSSLIPLSPILDPATRPVPSSVNDWIARPMPFSTETHGERALFSGHNSVVERRDPENNDDGCIAYTARPLPLGRVWNLILTVDGETTWKGLVSGSCYVVPGSLQNILSALQACTDAILRIATCRGNHLI